MSKFYIGSFGMLNCRTEWGQIDLYLFPIMTIVSLLSEAVLLTLITSKLVPLFFSHKTEIHNICG